MENHHRLELTFFNSGNFLRQNIDRTTENSEEHSDPPIKEMDFFSSSRNRITSETRNHQSQDDYHRHGKINQDGSTRIVTDPPVNVRFQIYV